MYRVYYGAANADLIATLEEARWPFKEFTQSEDALSWAQHVASTGTAVLAFERTNKLNPNNTKRPIRVVSDDGDDPGPAAA